MGSIRTRRGPTQICRGVPTGRSRLASWMLSLGRCRRPISPYPSMIGDLARERFAASEEWSPKPLILGGWFSPDDAKRERLREQIEWAAEHGVLEAASKFLRRLRDEDWDHEVTREYMISNSASPGG